MWVASTNLGGCKCETFESGLKLKDCKSGNNVTYLHVHILKVFETLILLHTDNTLHLTFCRIIVYDERLIGRARSDLAFFMVIP